MIKNNILDLANFSHSLNLNYNQDINKLHNNRKCVTEYLIDNTFDINLDTNKEWKKIIDDTIIKIHSPGNCSGLLINEKGGNVITAAHCINTIRDPAPDFSLLRKINNDKTDHYIESREHLHDWINFNIMADGAIFNFRSPNMKYLINAKCVYFLENPQDIKEYQPLFGWGITTNFKQVEYFTRDSFKNIYLTEFQRLISDMMSSSMITKIDYYGFIIDLSNGNSLDFNNFFKYFKRKTFGVRKIDNHGNYIPNEASEQGDSGGPYFIPFDNDKIALVGVMSTGMYQDAPFNYISALGAHIPEIERMINTNLKRVRIKYDYDNDTYRRDKNLPSIVIVPEPSNPVYNSFNDAFNC